MLKHWKYYICLIIIFCACNPNKNKNAIEYPDFNRLQKIARPELAIDRKEIRRIVQEKIAAEQWNPIKDSVLTAYYAKETSPFFWIENGGDNSRVNTLIGYLENSGKQHGLNPSLFPTERIREEIRQIKNINIQPKRGFNSLLADVEYHLTKAYFNYICFIGFGMIDPHAILNNMEDEEAKGGKISKAANGENKKKQFYNIPLKHCDRKFVENALSAISSDLPAYLQELQPKDAFYLSLQKELARIDSLNQIEEEVLIPEIGTTLLKVGNQHAAIPLIARKLNFMGYLPDMERTDSISTILTQEILEAVNAFRQKHGISKDVSIGSYTIRALNKSMDDYKQQIRLNMERLRWKPVLEKGDKYVTVNVAAYMLQAIDSTNDSVLEMKVCCGTVKNQTPLLSSKIHYIELNPYWNVPKSIIRKEMIPAYRRDTAYFRKNKLRIYDRSGRELNPHSIQWSKYRGDVPFDVKQDNKEGNSLGRLIFRFPNNFAVYLHDTPSRWSFMKTNRAVSHGCIRVEQALNFAFFLLKDKDDLLMDRIRVAIDLPAETEEGQKFAGKKDYKEMKYHILKEDIPVFLDYYTMYLSKNNELSYCEDIYKFDEPLIQVLDSLNAIKE